MSIAYLKILIHTIDSSLFPDADPDSVVWTGPPSEIVAVLWMLYASLATSFFAVFLTWVNRYLWSYKASAADKSRDRQQKLDGSEEWHFDLVIKSTLVMLQLATLLLMSALSLYLWNICRTTAWVIILVFVLPKVASCVSFCRRWRHG